MAAPSAPAATPTSHGSHTSASAAAAWQFDPPVDPRGDVGAVGVVLCHGFTGSPASMRPWAEHLATAGYGVRLPRLPGHGTSWQDMAMTGWPDWYAAVERALFDLSRSCATVVVAGLSMGGTLALRLAEEHPELVSGLVLVNPSVLTERVAMRALPLVRHVVGHVGGLTNDIKLPGAQEYGYERVPLSSLHSLTELWHLVRADLPRITAPLLLLRSTVDHVVEARNAAVIVAGVSSTDVTEIELTDSYHVATLDHDAALIFERSVDFVKDLA